MNKIIKIIKETLELLGLMILGPAIGFLIILGFVIVVTQIMKHMGRLS